MSEPRFGSLIDSFETLHVTVLGDLMLDSYIFGRVSRISPEAPVMVVRQDSERSVPGGAANVAKNAAALGASVSVVGVIGQDEPGQRLARELGRLEGIRSSVITDADRRTTEKTRIVADHSHQVLRVDREDDQCLSSTTESALIKAIIAEIPGSNVLVLSDYLKGTISPRIAAASLEAANSAGVPVVVNPKPKSALLYRGASLISLNRVEAAGLLGVETLSLADALEAAPGLCQVLGCHGVSVTLGEQGLVASNSRETFHVPAPRVEVYDTAGAGDTVISVIGLGIGAVGWDRRIFELAVEASSRVVRHVGVAVPSPSDLLELRSLRS